MKTESKQKRRKVRRKVFSLLLAIVLAATGIDLSLFTATVMAETTLSGTIGWGVSWSYDEETNTLTISGNGEMSNYSYSPFGNNGIVEKEGIHVTINEGVTKIGAHVFERLKMEEIQIPASVTTIGDYAFSNCTSLTTMVIPEKAKTIGENAFANCSALTSVKFEGTGKSLGKNSFLNCSSLTNVDLTGVESIGASAFEDAALNTVNLTGVKSIGASAFWGTDLSTVDLTGVTSLGSSAFGGCTSLTSVTFPADLRTIPSSIFWYCGALESVTIPESVTEIGENAFSSTGLISVTIPDSVTSIGNAAFSSCTSLTNIELPNALDKIPEQMFQKCSALTSVTIPESVTEIGASAFADTGLTSVTIPENVTKIGASAFVDTGLTSVTISESVTEIGKGAFSNTGLTSVTIPESVTKIGDYAFYLCKDLSEVTMEGEKPATIGSEVFSYCKFVAENTEGITVPEAVVGDYLTSWKDWSAYIGNKKEAVKQVIETALEEYTATKDTTEEEIKNTVEQKLAEIGLGNAVVVVEDFQKTDTKVSGTVNVTVGDGENAEQITITIEKKVTVQVPMEGLGTEEEPYQVNNKEALETLRDLVNGGADFTDIYFLITADIDLEGSGQNKWNPIGTAEHPFTGILDGDSHTISGLYINDETADNQGLFGVNAGTIQDVMVEGTVTGHDNAGGIAGINAATGIISGCVADVDVTGNDYVGGIAGKNEGMIENCTSYGTVTGNDYIGGIAGSNEETGTIKNGVNNGNVSVKGDGTGSHIGGITGENKNNTQDSVTGSYFQTDEVNKDITGIGGQEDTDSKVTSGNKPFPEPGKEFAGQGTQKRPYQIYTEEELKKLQTAIETNPEEYKDAHFELMEDITLTEEAGWTPIGTEEKPFEGIFNGNDHTVSGLKIEDNTADNQGLFGVNAGTIENLVVEGSVTGKDNVGGIVGTNTENGVIKDCTSNVTVTGENNVGGIAGKNDGIITGCTNNGTVTGTGTGTGGIVGNNNGLLKDDTNTAAVTGKNDVGGIAGTNGGNGTVEGCTNSGNVTGKEGNTPGAVIGNNQNAQADAVKNDYYQKTDTVNKDLTGIGEGTGAGTDPAGITSGQTPTNPDKPFKGSGTAEDPYKITGKDDLEKLRDLVNGGKDFKDTHFVVTKDIDLGGSGENPWTPIGTLEKPFEGIFNGNDHTVSGLKIEDNTADNQGLFGVNAGTIENLVVEGSVTGKDNVGGIAGINTNTGTIKDCTSSVTVTGENNVGGIAGRNDGTITDCTNKGTVTGTGIGAGGIAGNNSGSLDNDTNTASVTGKDDVGGVTGTNGANGTVEGCTNSGNVTGEGGNTPGAIIGNNQNTNPDAVKDDYYQKTDSINKDLTGIGEGVGSWTDPAGITSGQTPTRPEKPFDGSGTVYDPYKISSKEDLEKLRDLVNGGSDLSDVYFELTKDIDLGGGGGNLWTPIGTKENPFKGTLDGNRHTVSGLHINNETKDDQGLFGVNAGTIEDLTVEGNVTGKDNVGGIAGTNTKSGVIKDCTSSVTVTGENNVGGIAGKNDGTIMDCTNNGTVTGTGNNVGGITGNNTGTVIRDNNTGAVNGNDNVGGITGNNTGTVSGDNNIGAVNGNDNVGGITGNNTGTVSGDNNAGAVNGKDNVGGITGTNTGKVEGSMNIETVTGTGSGVGGIAGTNNGSLDNDTNTAPVTGKDDVGGITGANGENGTVEGCTNSGNVTVSGDGDSTPGAIIGNNQNTNPDAVKDDYYQKTDTVNKDLTGIGEGTGAGTDPAGITSGQTPTKPETPEKPEKPFDGSGTAQDPYKITSQYDLENLRSLVNGGNDFTDVHFELTKDIDLGGSWGNLWTPIGTEENPFKGTLDGDGHTVSGLHVNDGTKDNQGLFGVNAGTIENLTVEGSVTGKDNVGGIAGTNTKDGTIKGCTSNVTVTGENNVGGIAGKNDGTIADCTNRGGVTGTGTGAGGIAGTNNGSLEDDKNTAPVTGKDDVGGITGTNGEDGTVEGCTNSGNVTVSGDGNSTPGAVIGNNQNTDPDAVKDDYYQKTDSINQDLTGIGEGTGAGRDPAGITSGQTPVNPEKPFNGAGTAEDPYKISGKDDLENLRDLVNGGKDFTDVHFELTKDIDLGGSWGNPWTPIGTEENPFKGTLDGDGHTVSGLYTNDGTKDNQGLFGVNAGTIENLTVEGSVTGKDNVGGIAGTNTESGVIKDCTSNVTVTGENNVGGIAGKNDGTITDCTNNGTVTGTGNNAGGITGTNTGTVNGSDNIGAVNGNDNVGGVTGNNTGTVNGSDNTGAVSGNDNVGGITGNNTGKVEDSTNRGTVTGTGTGAGGIAGTNNGSLEDDKNTAPVTGKDDVGGITGTNGEDGTVEGCTNSGNVTVSGDGDSTPGAVIGNNQNTDPDAVKDDYYQKTDSINQDLTGIGEGTGAGRDPAGITSGQTPMNPEKPFIGSGTAEDPYKISGKDDLENLRDLVNDGKDFTDVHFEVTKDIDLGGSWGNPWTPIGTEENPFKGTLDGDGHTVSGLHTNDGTKDNQGLFGVNAGTIENLTVEGSVTGKDNVGGIAGTNTESGVIKDCTSNVTVTGENNVGGIAGKNDGTITDCTNNGTVTGTGNNAGGITGNNTGTVNGSDNTGAVNGNDNVGGITGTNTGKVEGSTNRGTVTGTGTGAGGIAGTNNGSLDNDTNTAPVTGKDDVGGITGTNGGNGTVEGCTNSGNVTVSGDGDSTPGAIIGNNQNTNPDAVKDDYYQKTDTVNKDLTGIGEGTGAGKDPAGITSGQTPTKPGGNPAGTDQAAAKAFEDEKIAAIERATPVGGTAWKQAVRDAIEAFGRLTAGQKELVSANAKKILTDAQAILAAVEKIEAIGTVVNTAECGQKIKAARDAYDRLTSEQKAKIPESIKKILTDAERAYAALQNGSQNGGQNLTQEEKKQIQTIAKELGVSEETAAKIQAVAKELGVSVDTILLNDDTILKQKSENDVKGSTFARLKAKASKVTKTSVKLTWKKVKGADGYLVYGTKCGIKNTYKLLKSVKKNGTAYTQKKLKKGGQYKYIVRAYKLVDGKKITIAASKTVHVHTAGGKYGNPKSVTVNKTRAYLVKGKSLKVKAALAKTSKKLKRHRSVWVFFESSNTKVATVTKKGVIKAKAKGTCTIYVYAQNGVYKEIKVTVTGKAKKSTSIKLNKKKYSMKKGASYTLKPTVKPATSTDTVKWTSSNKKVATVDAYGTVKAKKKGTATITAKTTSGKKATCKITVK